ncbi:EamA family transporter [Sulfolobales archaeon HS-7]|nr:EamA family transporter [Sulfolobales archaeon HS-7]
MLGVLICWGLSYPLTKLALLYMSPFTLTFFRFAVGGIILAIYSRGISLTIRDFVNSALNGAFFVLLLNLAIMFSENPAFASVLIYSQPIFVLIIYAVVFKTKVNRLQISGILLSFLGITISAGLSGPNLGVLIALSAAILWAFGTVYFRKNLSGESLIKTNASLAIISAILVLPTIAFSPHFTFGAIPILLALGVTATAQVLGYIFWFGAVRDIGPVNAGAISLLVPVTAYLLTAAILGVLPTLIQAIGSAIAITGVFLSQWMGIKASS